MQRILVIGLALLTPLTVSADISDEALVSTCLADVDANMALPDGTSSEILRPACECVAESATDTAVRENLVDYTEADPADRTYMLEDAAREILWDCFNVPEEHRIVPEPLLEDRS